MVMLCFVKNDRLDFAWGRMPQVSVAERRLQLVPCVARQQPAWPVAAPIARPVAPLGRSAALNSGRASSAKLASVLITVGLPNIS